MDWKTLITELRDAGLTQQEIATHMGTSQGHVSDIQRGNKGKHLSYHFAAKLIDLHKSRVAPTPHPDETAREAA